MNQQLSPETEFSKRLRAELTAIVAARGAEAELATAARPAWRRPVPRLALGAAGALAAIVVAILVIASGPSAEPAAAEVLRQTAAIAAASDAPAQVPGPGQLLFQKTERMELQEWNDELTASYGGILPRPKDSFAGFIRWREEAWMSNKRWGRDRLVLDSTEFLSAAERQRWQAAGSPLPFIFGGEIHPYKGMRLRGSSPGVYDVETLDGPGYGRFKGLPTEPRALRRAIERRQLSGPGAGGAESIDTGQVIAELWEILDKSNSRPALRAAVFNALAEEPGIELDRDVTDMVGRSGYSLSYDGRGAGRSEYQLQGRRVEYIFDPDTSAVLGRRESVADPAKIESGRKLPPAGTVLNEVAYLGTGIVDSTHQRPAPAGGAGPKASAPATG